MFKASVRASNPSIIQLISGPDRWRGAEIKVSGFLVPDGEPPDAILYFDRESAKMGFLQNAVHVRVGQCRYVTSKPGAIQPLEISNMKPGYAVVGGVFEPALLDDPWPYAGEICSVTSLSGLSDPDGAGGHTSFTLKARRGP
jgi:hypothetical protein